MKDAHRRLVLQVYLGSNSSVLYTGKMFVSRKTKFTATYVATRPEVEGFRDQDFVLQYYLK